MANEINIDINDDNEDITIHTDETVNNVSETVGGDPYYTDLAREWAIKEGGKILGIDYSSKHYALLAKQSEEIATEAIGNIGASVEDAQEYAQAAEEAAEYIVNHAPTVTVTQTETGAIVTATDMQGTTTATLLNGAKGDPGTNGQDGVSPIATVTKSGTVTTITITDKNGTTTEHVLDGTGSISDVKVNNVSVVTDGVANITTPVPNPAYATSTSAAATVEKAVSIPSITELNVGQVIVVQPSVTSTVANSTIKLNDFTAYPMRYNGAAITTSTDSIVWSSSFVSQFVFDGSYWQFLGHGLDSNTTYTINYLIDAGSITSGTETYAITRYSLIMQKPNETWEKITATNAAYSTGTTKSVNTSGFLLGSGVKYYNTTTNLANGSKSGTAVIQSQSASVDMRYSTNCGAAPAWAVGDYVYLVGTLGADGLFYLDTTTWWTNTLPSTANGKLYIQLGLFLSDAKISLIANQPVLYNDGTGIKEYIVANNKQDKLVSGTNIKTINNESILGSGNITVSGGGIPSVINGGNA